MTPDVILSQLGVKLEYTSELPPLWVGAYLDDEKRVLIRRGLTPEQDEQARWHETAHAYYRDRESTPAIERRAWVYAARMIVDPLAYAAAERISTSSMFIAQELGTTTRIIETYRAAIVSGELRLAA